MTRALLLLTLIPLVASAGEQSAFNTQSQMAERIAELSWVMFYGAVVITLLVSLLTALAVWGPARARQILSHEKTVVWGGIVFPVVVLSALLAWGFWLLGQNDRALNQPPDLQVTVIGEQWWWRVIYHHPDGSTTETANEIRLPVNTNVQVQLESADVIHSFWIPSWAGKVDMIPGRTNYLHLNVRTPGIARGQCAEYCGGPHALMAFYGMAMPAAEFAAWLAQLKAPANPTAHATGRDIFQATGCGACHTVRGTAAAGTIGPALTHVGSRLSLGAGTLGTSEEQFAQWLKHHQELKPENLMPAFDFLEPQELSALARYLKELE